MKARVVRKPSFDFWSLLCCWAEPNERQVSGCGASSWNGDKGVDSGHLCANRHFVPTKRFIRLQGEARDQTVASPDLPLFQVGGVTFGRHERGAVQRHRPVLLAWLNNNYWDTNFEVTQAGPLRTRFWLVAHAAEVIGKSVELILPYAAEPQFHALRASGSARVGLFDVKAEGLMLTGFERSDDAIRIFVLNTEGQERHLDLGLAALTPRTARCIALDGSVTGSLDVAAGQTTLPVPGRTWIGIALEVI